MPPGRILTGFVVMLAAGVVYSAPRESPPARIVWDGPEANVFGAPSRDGRWLSYVDPQSGDLAVRHLETGQVRFVTRRDPKSQRGEFAYFSVISPDAKRIAFAWFNSQRFYDLRVAEIPDEGEAPSPPRVLYSNREAGFVQPCAFSPDGQRILTLFFRRDNISQISLVSTDGSGVLTLKSLNWIYPKRMDFSPDGSWIVYDNLSAEAAEERDIFALAVDGSREIRLLSGLSNDLFPLWSPDGREVVFISDRFGSTGVCAVAFADGHAAGPPRLLRGGLDRVLPLGMTTGGDLYYAVRTGRSDIHVAKLGASDLPPPVLNADTGRNFGAVFSPDGSTIAYLSLRGSENYGLAHRAVLLYSLDQKTSHELPVRLAHVERLAWSPDGSHLLVAGSDRRGRNGLFEYELKTAKTLPVVLSPQSGYRGLEGAYVGSRIAYLRPGSPARIVLLNPSDQSSQTIYQAPQGANLAALAVSPDTGRIGFAQLHPAAEGEVMLLSLRDTKPEKLLTLPGGRLTDLTWMPDGKRLLVGTEASSGAHLWSVSAAGDAMQPALHAPKREPGVSVHPDGRRVALTIGEVKHQIWMLEKAGSADAAPSH